MKKIILLFCILISGNFYATTAERLLKVQQRILIVELPAIDIDYINGLKEEGKLDDVKKYQSKCDYFRSSIKAAFAKIWTFNSRIEYVSSDSVQSFINGYTHMYAIMRYGDREKYNPYKFNVKYVQNYGIASFNLYLTDEENEVLYFYLPIRKTLGNFILGLHQINLSIEVMFKHPKLNATCVNSYSHSNEDLPTFDTKNNTLLLNADDFKGEKIDDNKISKVYPYKYKVVDNIEWENAIINQDKNYSCLTFYLFPVAVTTYSDKNKDGNSYNDFSDASTGGMLISLVHLAYNGYGEAGGNGNDLVKILITVKKHLDKSEKNNK